LGALRSGGAGNAQARACRSPSCALKQDYRDMTMMIFGDAPRFESIVEKLTALEGEVDNVRTA
jgi:hypothetical protein